MITLCSTPKPFRGHIGVIQRNAIASWRRLDPEVEVMLVGDDEGTAEICAELGLGHIVDVRSTESGAKRLNDIFRALQQRARHDYLCYLNCDIVLLSDFLVAARQAAKWRRHFLMVGQRTDVELQRSLNFNDSSTEGELRELARQHGQQRDEWWIDFFLFHREMFRDVPDLLIGRAAWDNWMIYKAKHDGYAVIDATSVVLPVHQNHDYGHHPDGQAGVFRGLEAAENRRLAGGRDHLYRISDADFRLTSAGIRRNITVPHIKRVLDNSRRSARRVLRTMRQRTPEQP